MRLLSPINLKRFLSGRLSHWRECRFSTNGSFQPCRFPSNAIVWKQSFKGCVRTSDEPNLIALQPKSPRLSHAFVNIFEKFTFALTQRKEDALRGFSARTFPLPPNILAPHACLFLSSFPTSAEDSSDFCLLRWFSAWIIASYHAPLPSLLLALSSSLFRLNKIEFTFCHFSVLSPKIAPSHPPHRSDVYHDVIKLL